MEGHGEAVEDEGVSRAGAERTELVMQQAQSQRGGQWEAGGCGDRGPLPRNQRRSTPLPALFRPSLYRGGGGGVTGCHPPALRESTVTFDF